MLMTLLVDLALSRRFVKWDPLDVRGVAVTMAQRSGGLGFRLCRLSRAQETDRERDLSEDGKERSSEMRTRRRTFLPFALGRPTTASDIWRRAGSILTPKSFFLAYFS